MNMPFSKPILWMVLPLLSLASSACKKDSSAGSEPAKTLNKSTLTTKAWFNKGGTTIHDFRGNGIYSNTGTWKWKNNSDTLEIVPSPGGFKTYWKMFWNTEHEMNCQRVGTSSPELYKDQMW